MRNLTKKTVLAGIASVALSLGATSANAVPIEWTTGSGGNGHFYDFVSTTSLLWSGARAAALAQTHNSQPGYLVTLTSAPEYLFYLNTFGSVQGWIGGSDIAVEGVWLWMDGPEAGQQFWQGAAGGSATAPFNFAAWNGGEPNNVGGEHVANFQGGAWNDLPITSGLSGYLVEFNAAPIVDEPPVTGVPEPITLSLLGAGLFGIGLARRRRA